MRDSWWQFWRPRAWRAWRADRSNWKQAKASGLSSSALRPLSPGWALGAALVLVAAVSPNTNDGGMPRSAPTAPLPFVAIEAADSLTTTSATPTTTRPTVTTSSTTTTTTAVPTTSTSRPVQPRAAGSMTVHFIDVGQGDATLLQGPNFTVLIDTGRHNASEVVPYLRSVGVKHLDLLIATHPHADHIGQIPQVLGAFPVDEVWMSATPHTTQAYERALDAILRSDAGYHEPTAGEMEVVGSLLIQVLSPSELTGDPNRDSIAVRAVFGEVSFLFTGDASAAEERQMVRNSANLSTTVLHVGHHGSRGSTTTELLKAARPGVAIYSAGANNSYGHPHPEVLQRLSDVGTTVYGTAVHGTIRVNTDGSTIQVTHSHSGSPTTTSTTTPAATSTTTKATTTTTKPSGGSCSPGQVNVNTAGYDDLLKIIHIGPVRAEEMLKIRPFKSVNDMIRINGIGAARLADIKAQGVACVP